MVSAADSGTVPSRARIAAIIREAIAEVAQDLDQSIDVNDSPEMVLYGESSALTSLAVVAVVITVEQSIEDECGVQLSLADDRAMSRQQSPFATVGSLTDYVAEQLHGL